MLRHSFENKFVFIQLVKMIEYNQLDETVDVLRAQGHCTGINILSALCFFLL